MRARRAESGASPGIPASQSSGHHRVPGRRCARERTADDGAVTVERAGELYHDSDTLNVLADSIGVTIPWGELPE
ncbi:MAG: hypothetical protein ACOC2Y_00765 [Spirochaetota bacterium]